jgi:hypothetical protein
MSVLCLDSTQRLNVHALIGMQRATVDEMRAFWKIQDAIDLSSEEKQAIGYHVQQVDGRQQIGWETGRTLAPKEYQFTQDEVQKIADVVKKWQSGYQIGADRIWLEPLLGQLENGASPWGS